MGAGGGCGDGSGRGCGDNDFCCWQRSQSWGRFQWWSPKSLISQPHAWGGRGAAPAASRGWEGCAGCPGGRSTSGKDAAAGGEAPAEELTGRSCWQAAVYRVAAALQHQLTFGELLPVPLRRSSGSAVAERWGASLPRRRMEGCSETTKARQGASHLSRSASVSLTSLC